MATETLLLFLITLTTTLGSNPYQRMPSIGRMGFQFGFPSFPKMGRFPSPFDSTEKEGDDFKTVFKGFSRPLPGMKTKVHNETKGNTTTYTVEQNGKGYHSFSQFTMSKNNPGMMSQGFSEDIQSSGDDEKGTRAQEVCGPKKPCPQGLYCNPVLSVCHKETPLGERCQFKSQCEGADANCIWGKCKKAKYGSSGSLCQKDADCHDDTYCSSRYEISPYYDICTLKLGEGAPCGDPRGGGAMSIISGFLPFQPAGRLESREQRKRNPCKDGLVCEPVGVK